MKSYVKKLSRLANENIDIELKMKIDDLVSSIESYAGHIEKFISQRADYLLKDATSNQDAKKLITQLQKVDNILSTAATFVR